MLSKEQKRAANVTRDIIQGLARDLAEAQALLRMVRDDLDVTHPDSSRLYRLSPLTELRLSNYMLNREG